LKVASRGVILCSTCVVCAEDDSGRLKLKQLYHMLVSARVGRVLAISDLKAESLLSCIDKL
jgi:hypothetical protein